MSADEPRRIDSGSSSRLWILPLLYGLLAVLAVIATATYASGVTYFLEAGNERAAIETALATIGALIVAIASAAAAYGLQRRARWSWYCATGVALVWTGNGIRTVVIDGLSLPSSLVIGVTLCWLLWSERGALGVDPVDRMRSLRG